MDAKSARLVRRCVADVGRKPVDNVDIYLEDDLSVWHVALRFTEETPFLGGSELSLRASGFPLYLTLSFSQDFPARPPTVKFESPWMNHQHLWGNRICHSLLTDEFSDFFREKGTHGTSMWNAACALADGDGIGGMPRYLQVLREFLGSDLDYDEEKHVRYDEASLQSDVQAQQAFVPEWLGTASLLGDDRYEEAPMPAVSAAAEAGESDAASWGTDFFLKTPLIAGDPECHPCFDVSLAPGRLPSLTTTMTSLSVRSFDMGARTTDFGTPIAAMLPYPCSRQAWQAVGSGLASSALERLAPLAANYRLQLPDFDTSTPEAAPLEAILDIVGEIWKTTCIGIVKEEGYESERAMTCFVTLHFLLLCLVEEFPGLVEAAARSVQQFLNLITESAATNVKACVPDMGRFLVRFLLTEDSVPLQANISVVVRELFSRNQRWIQPHCWPEEDASESEKIEQIQGSFETSQFGMKLTVFQAYYILRSKELGLNKIEAHEASGGRPTEEVLRLFQQDCREIKALASYQEFLRWLQLDADADVHAMLCDAVEDSETRGYNGGLHWR